MSLKAWLYIVGGGVGIAIAIFVLSLMGLARANRENRR